VFIHHRVSCAVVVCAAAAIALGACRKKEAAALAVATPSVTLNHPRVPLGSPIDITYKFEVAPSAHFDQDYRVLVHVLDSDDEMMWTDDHNPPVPTTQWKPGQTVEYTRTVFVPVYPYIGEATIQLGLYSPADQKRLVLNGQDMGQRAYKVTKFQLQPQTENVFTVFKEGWHPAEVAEHNATVEWQWTKKDALLDFKNPKKDCVFYFDVDNPGSVFHESQHVQVALGSNIVDEFTLDAGQSRLRKIPLTATQLGSGEMAELHITVDKTFVPALLNAVASKDPRELGVRVFHAYIDPR
jgi:hypothetical protein